MGRHERRATQARHKASLTRTYLVAPDDAELDTIPILWGAARSWLNNLPTRIRSCIICSNWIPDRREVGALLLSTPVTVQQKTASVCGICVACWAMDFPLEILEKASERELQEAIPGGRFLD
jgi:hypothetical protein